MSGDLPKLYLARHGDRDPLAELDELVEQGLLPDHRKSEGVNDLHGLGWSTHETALFSGRKLRCPLAEPDELLE